ncbi:T9SS type A sorting domain-containing protein [Chryseobacterium gambrini]|uniref:T9SS type A sorting domain-containing protein n=1 Tax=Chryseobacterium gambrini TaxID=373672 RepID=A0ABM8K4U4_9FLAO|nr:T9SS type A sorting domain-containing protein [Chryseobacterium gambrini]
MKIKLFLLSLLLFQGFLLSQTVTIDLSTGKNDDGTLMNAPPPDVTDGVSVTDPDWSVVRPGETTPVNTKTRHTYPGWSSPGLTVTGSASQSRWITDKDGWATAGDGYYYYYSKSFTIPNGAVNATLNFRSLSFVRNWTYLVRTDVSPNTEELITQTAWMSDGAKGWLNSRSPEVLNKPLSAGTYIIKVKLYTNNGGVTNALNVYGLISYTPQSCTSPVPEVNSPVTYCQNAIASSLSATGTGLLWYTTATGGTGSNTAPTPSTANSGTTSYYVSQTIDGCEGERAKIDVIVNATPDTPGTTTPITYCQNDTASPLSATGTGLLWYTTATGGTGSATAPTPSTANSGAVSYYVSQTVNGCESTRAKIDVVVNPPATLALSSGSNTQTVDVNTPILPIVYTFSNAANIVVNGLPSGVTGVVNNNTLTISGTPTAVGTFNYSVATNGGCGQITLNGKIDVTAARDWRLAPNSYIFDPNLNNDGFYIPVKKAYAMWKDQNGLLNDATVLNGTPTAEVYWEDVAGIIRSTNYSLPMEGSGEDAKIKVEINKAKGEGNAVVALKINNKIVWSWHVWVTDNPSNGVTYGNVRAGAETASYLENGVVKKFTPKWMDRNLGATNKDFTGYNWDKSGGLMYQWGRKDPFPAFEYKDSSKYEISGTIGTKKHLYDYTGNGTTNKITSMQRPYSDINSNIKYSVNNPLDLIFTNTVAGHAWFVQNIGTDNATRKKSDLWGDNSQLAINTAGSTVNTYKPKTSYDPCPNNWRVPSYINNTFATTVSNTFSPWGRDSGSPANDLASFVNTKPTTINQALKGVKIYPNLGIDFTNTYSGSFPRNMGIYPGNGKYVVGSTGDFYHQDPHEIIIQSATVTASSTPYSYFFSAYGDAGQLTSKPDPATPPYQNMIGRYYTHAYESSALSGAMACRCVEDKYAKGYDFPTSFFTNAADVNYTEGLKDPNTYLVTRATTEREIKIPISKAFSVYNQYLSDHGMRDFSNLKVNVYWSDNRSLISNIKVINAPANKENIKDAYISVKVAPDQSGNAVVSLHNGNVSAPAYWSWHIWVTNTNVDEVAYQTEDVLLPADANYVNFTNSGAQPMKNIFMDRNLGATDAFPNVINPESVTPAELAMINNSGGMQYQWGRKDPIPSFITPGLIVSNGMAATGNYSIWTSSGPDAGGNVYPSSFSELTENTYGNTYIKRRDTDYGNVGITKAENIMNNLKYSAENPLAFMVPGTKYTNRASLNAFYGQDWLYSTPNQMMDRWGHAASKSVFDPCPGGWRVPDTSIGVVDNDPNDPNHLDDNKGSSPWYNGFYKKNATVDPFRIHSMGIVQEVDFEIKNPTDIYNGGVPYYLGNTVKNTSTVYGYQFGNSANTNNPNLKYKIGNYPVTGFRGFSNNDAISAAMKLGISGVWTATLRSANSYGTAYNLTFLTNSLTSSKLVSMNDVFINHPMNAMNVRCVKEESKFGQLLGTAANTGIITGTNRTAKNILEKNPDVEIDNIIDVYPNPFNSFITVKGEGLKSYELYDISGKLLKQGSLLQKTINTNDLIKGEYLLKIITDKNIIKVKKIIKN